ncbi:MAG: hypothetical protein IJJ33_03095, partial [Victivallales bacterium]|nr:hypothetical protein [Victivallales bacterium]
MNSHTFLSIFTAGAFALAPCVCADGLPAYAAAENARLDREMTPLLKLSGPAEGNLARGKCYDFSDRPNYSLCSGESDATDLTNGRSESSADGIWFCKDCVCWAGKTLVSVTIDLAPARTCIRPAPQIPFSESWRSSAFSTASSSMCRMTRP